MVSTRSICYGSETKPTEFQNHAGQGMADGLPGFPSHYQGMAHGYFFKARLLPRDVPGDGVVTTDNPVGGHGGDKDDFHLYFCPATLKIRVHPWLKKRP